MMMINTDFSQDMQRCRDYIHALEEERRKIQVFQRELPLSLELVQQAIETYKQQLSGTTVECNLTGQSECSEQTSSDVPVFEEFIPIKRASSHSEEHDSDKDEDDEEDDDGGKTGYCNDKNSKKSDWLRSVQLWNQSPDPCPKEDSNEITERKRSVGVNNDGAFYPFKKGKSVEKSETPPPPPAAETSGGGNKKDDKDGQSNRKTRRCWSPELHRRFLQALQELGGSHVATPKQIRELMKVDGLTNDEVKSHLQKYRLHTRRPSPTIQSTTTRPVPVPPQFVVVGGIWVPPEYASMASTATTREPTSAGIYAPIATLPPHLAKRERPLEPNHGGSRKSNSPATSSSTHCTTLSDH